MEHLSWWLRGVVGIRLRLAENVVSGHLVGVCVCEVLPVGAHICTSGNTFVFPVAFSLVW